MMCPHCKKDNPLNTTIDGDTTPRKNDISFCIGCGELAMFTSKGLQKLDIRELSNEDRKGVLEIRTAWLKVNNVENIKDGKS